MSISTLLLSVAPTVSELPFAAHAATESAADADRLDEASPNPTQLQIGDFVLGDEDCPSLTGHPDIRY